MSSDSQTQCDAAEEAAQWFARLNDTSISTADLSAFRVWRLNPAHDAAYRAVEQSWRDSGSLQSDPDIQAALMAARERSASRRAPRRRWLLGWGGALGAIAVAAAGALLIFTPSAFGAHTYQTGVGEQSTVALDDGSHVKLDTNSRIDVRFTSGSRLVTLVRGQAFFDVVHQANRPLQVKAGATLIRDLGTRFDVRDDGAGAVRITVVEGSIQVAAAHKPAGWTLTAGQQIVTDHLTKAPYSVDPAKATSWTSGRLIFEDMTLAAATGEMNRYGQHKLILRAGGVGAIKVNGVFESTDTPAFVAAVTRLYDLKAETQPDGSILLSNAAPERAG